MRKVHERNFYALRKGKVKKKKKEGKKKMAKYKNL